MLYTFSLVHEDGTKEELFRHATINVVTKYVERHAPHLKKGESIEILPWIDNSPPADWDIELLAVTQARLKNLDEGLD